MVVSLVETIRWGHSYIFLLKADAELVPIFEANGLIDIYTTESHNTVGHL
jgi:hypothetical protein